MNFIEALEWRYATKKMDGRPIPEDKIERILDAIRFAPSSIGLQPYNIIVVKDPVLRQQIVPVANNQQQIVDCSHLLVFAAWDTLTKERSDAFIALNATTRNADIASLAQLQGYLDYFATRPEEVNFNWMARQAYIAFGIAIAAAALEEVDATPMEGFDGPKLDQLLELDQLGLKSVTILPLGYRDAANDWLAPLKKVRREKEQLFIRK